MRPRPTKRVSALIVALLTATVAGRCRAAADGVVVVVLTENGVAPYRDTLAAMRPAVPGQVTTIDVDTAPDALGDTRRAHPQAIVAIGQKALTLVAHAITDVPIVYCSVLFPEQHGLSGSNVTGVPLEIPIATQLERFHAVAPKVKRIGMIHSAAVAAEVTEATAAAGKLGLRIVAQSIGASKDVADAFGKLSGQIDALMLLPDSKVMNKDVFNYLLRTSLDANIPLFGFLEGLTQAGALASVSPDYQDIGTRAGDLVTRALERGRALPPKTYSRGALSINLRTAQRLGIDVDERAQHEAQKVFR